MADTLQRNQARDRQSIRKMVRSAVYGDRSRKDAAEDALATMVSDMVESSDFLANILESSTEYSIIAKDLDRRILSWNAGAKRNYGYEPHEVLGRFSDILHEPSDLAGDHVQALHEQALRNGQAEGKFLRRRKDGTTFVASVVITRRTDRRGNPVGYLLISRDISEEERLRREAEEYRLFLDNILESSTQYSIIAKDLDRRIVSWNAGARRNYGYEADEVLGRTADFLHDEVDLQDHTMERLHREALLHGHAEGIFHRRRKDGSTFPVRAVITRRDDAEGRPVGYLVISREITEEQRLRRASEERQRKLEEADRRKDEFLATLGHELRNPLAPLAMASELLKRDFDPDSQKRFLGIIDRQIAHMSRLINDLLDIARVSRGKIRIEKEPMPISRALQQGVEIARPLIDKKHQEFTLTDGGEALLVDGDLVRLAQVFGNLLRNASKYTPEGGRIEARLQPGEGEVLVSISDTGCGIPADKKDRIFEPFIQGSSKATGGLGIGLTLVKSIVELHGGTIAVQSPGVDQGSTFTVRLPLAASPPPVASPAPTSAPPPGPGSGSCDPPPPVPQEA